MNQTLNRYLPADDAQRVVLHNEIHTRPSATFKLPALIVYVAVLNKDVSKESELAHLQKLALEQDLPSNAMATRSSGSGTQNSPVTRFFSHFQRTPSGAASCQNSHPLSPQAHSG